MEQSPSLEKLKYPVGTFEMPETVTEAMISNWIASIANFYPNLEKAIENAPEEAFSWVYRPDGWTVKQVIHHCADSHMNALMRFKLALTEDAPQIKPYFEGLWAALPDMTGPVEESLWLLKGLHARWARLLRLLTDSDLDKVFVHPEHGRSFTLRETIGMYAWHSNHHLAHVKQALKYQGKFSG